jgi:hypothetical protein
MKQEESEQAMVDRAAQRAQDVIDVAHEQGQRLTDDVSRRTRQVETRVDEAAARAGKGFKSAADRLRGSRSESGVIGSAVDGVADTMQRVGSYLEDRASTRIIEDLENVIRRNPLRTVFTSLAVGYLLARRLRA